MADYQIVVDIVQRFRQEGLSEVARAQADFQSTLRNAIPANATPPQAAAAVRTVRQQADIAARQQGYTPQERRNLQGELQKQQDQLAREMSNVFGNVKLPSTESITRQTTALVNKLGSDLGAALAKVEADLNKTLAGAVRGQPRPLPNANVGAAAASRIAGGIGTGIPGASRSEAAGNVNKSLQDLLATDAAGTTEYVKTLSEITSQLTQIKAQRLEMLAGDGKYLAANAALVRSTVERQTAVQLLGNQDGRLAAAQIALNQARNVGRTNVATGTLGNSEAIEAQVARTEAEKLASVRAQISVIERSISGENGLLQAETELRAARDRQTRTANEQAIAANGGSQIGPGGTAFQRFRAGIQARQQGGVADPTHQETLSQFVGSRAATTAGFALSGAALYGGIQALQSSIKETEQLDQQFALLKQQFKDVGDGNEFQGFRTQILGIARDTGVSAQEVATVGFQLKGAFKDTTTAVNNTRIAMELVKTTGLSITDITNGLTATASAYGVSFGTVGDKVTALSNRYGVMADQSVEAFSIVAQSAHQAGLSFDQIGEIIGAVGRDSGKGASAIGSSLSNILPELQKNARLIEQIYQQAIPSSNGKLTQAGLNNLTSNLANGRSGAALEQLLGDQAANRFNKQQQTDLINTIAPKPADRSTATSLFSSAREITNTRDDSGALQQRFDAQQRTLQQKLAQLAETARQVGVELGNAGVLDAFKGLADGGLILVSVLDRVLRDFDQLDNLAGGIPGKIIAVVLAVQLLRVAISGLQRLGGQANTLFGGARSAEAAATAAATAGTGGAVNDAARNEVDKAVRRNPVQRVFDVIDPNSAQNTARRTSGGDVAPAAQKFNARIKQALSTSAEDVSTGLKSGVDTFRQKLSAGIGRISDPFGINNPSTATPVGRLGQAGNFISGGQGLGGVANAGLASVAAAGALYGLYQQVGQTRKDVNGAQSGAANRLEAQSLGQLLAERQAGQFEDNFATSAATKLGLQRKSVNATGSEAIRNKARSNFDNAVAQGLFDPNDPQVAELKKRIDDKNANKKTVADAIKKLATLNADDQKRIDDATKAQSQSGADAKITDVATKYQLGTATFAEYQKSLSDSLDVLRNAATSNDPQDLAALIAKQQEFNQSIQAETARINALNATAQANQGATAAQAFTQNQATLDAGIPNADSVATPGAPDSAVPVNNLANPAQAQQRVDQYKQRLVEGRAAIDEALRNGATDLNAVVAQFQLTPAELQDYLNAQKAAGNGIVQDAGVLKANIQEALQDRQNKIELANAQIQDLTFTNSNPSVALNAQRNQAQKNLDSANSTPGVTDLQKQQARNDLDSANKAISDRAKAVTASADQLRVAQANGDPVAVANAQVKAARDQIAAAGGDTAAYNAAAAQLAQARQSGQQAQEGIAKARIAVQQAQHPTNELEQAQLQQKAAAVEAQYAVGAAAQLTAQAAKIAADKSVEKALADLSDSRIALLKAQADAVGDTVRSSQLSLQQTQDALNRLLKDDPTNQTAINQARTAVTEATSQTQTSQLDTARATIEFQHQMKDISDQQYVAQLRALEVLAVTPQQIRDIELAIKGIQDQAGQNFQFNLPGNLDLPTLYDARRLNQSGASAFGAGAAQDNRVITITLNANNSVDGQQAVATIVSALNEAPRLGTQPRLY